MRYFIFCLMLWMLLSGCGTFHLEGRLELHPNPSDATPAFTQTLTLSTSSTDTELYPILPDAYNLLSSDGAIVYRSRTDKDTAIEFYESQMTERGWSQDGYFEQGRGVTLLFIDERERDLTVVIRSSSPTDDQSTPVTQISIDHPDGFLNIRVDD